MTTLRDELFNAGRGGTVAIAELLDDFGTTADPTVVTDKVLDRLLGMRKADLRAALFPIVLHSVVTDLRNLTRAVERRSVAPPDAAEPYDATAGRRCFLAAGFYSPAQSRLVTWGEATPADHQSRAEYLRNMAEGLIHTAEMHERAAAILRAKGAVCLNDIPDFDPRELGS